MIVPKQRKEETNEQYEKFLLYYNKSPYISDDLFCKENNLSQHEFNTLATHFSWKKRKAEFDLNKDREQAQEYERKIKDKNHSVLASQMAMIEKMKQILDNNISYLEQNAPTQSKLENEDEKADAKSEINTIKNSTLILKESVFIFEKLSAMECKINGIGENDTINTLKFSQNKQLDLFKDIEDKDVDLLMYHLEEIRKIENKV